MPVEEVRKLINAIDDKKTEFNYPPFISKKLRDLVEIPEPIELQQKIDDKFKQSNSELIQANNELKLQMKDIQELLNNFIKNSNANNGIANNDINDKIDDKNT